MTVRSGHQWRAWDACGGSRAGKKLTSVLMAAQIHDCETAGLDTDWSERMS